MLQYIQAAREFLAAINPDLPAAAFVALVFLVVLAIRKAFPSAWEKWSAVVPVLAIDPSPVLVLLSKAWQAVPAAVIGAVLAALQSGADVRTTVYGALLALLAPVAHELAKNYKGTLGASKPRLPPVLPVLYLFGLAAFVSVQPWMAGCAAVPSKAAVSDVVQRSSALAFNGATLALLYLDEQEAKRLDALPHPTELELQQATAHVERLTRARDALAIVRKALSGELGDLDERGKLREAVEALDLVASELEADGVKLPKDLQSALAAARVVL